MSKEHDQFLFARREAIAGALEAAPDSLETHLSSLDLPADEVEALRNYFTPKTTSKKQKNSDE